MSHVHTSPGNEPISVNGSSISSRKHHGSRVSGLRGTAALMAPRDVSVPSMSSQTPSCSQRHSTRLGELMNVERWMRDSKPPWK